MKVVQINATCGTGSTGKICVALSELMSGRGIENHIFYSQGESDNPLGVRYMQRYEVKAQALCSRILGNYGFNSVLATRRLLKKLDEIQPDIVHLHNLHSHNCNLSMLFSYLRRHNTRILWTFHDCWAFTGYCTHFTMSQCDQWKTGCNQCPQKKLYSWLLDRSKNVFERKRKAFSSLNMTIITPSHWLAGIVNQSFLKEYPVGVIHNGIDLNVFRPIESCFRKKYGISEEKKILLGVAFDWSERKGLDVFAELSGRLDPEVYQIVLVGTDRKIDRSLPDTIISIHKTRNQQELAEIYTAAAVFLNPTREENYPTVNMEAIACGTPVITFRTGGSPESVCGATGAVVECDDIDALVSEIRRITSQNLSDACLGAREEFDQEYCYAQYLQFYLHDQ